MSISLMTTFFTHDFENPLTKFVLIALADNASDEGFCYPKIQTIMKKCSMSERAVYYHIKNLEDLGYLERVNNSRKEKSSRRVSSNEYMVKIPNHLHDMQVAPAPHAGGSDLLLTIEPSIKPILADKSAQTQNDQEEIEEKFALFWKYYPTKVKKAYCEKLFKKLNPDDELFKSILIGLRDYVDFVESERRRGFDRQYQHPSTWLTNKGWEDEIVTAQNSQYEKPQERITQGRCQIQNCNRTAHHLYGGRTLCDSHFDMCKSRR